MTTETEKVLEKLIFTMEKIHQYINEEKGFWTIMNKKDGSIKFGTTVSALIHTKKREIKDHILKNMLINNECDNLKWVNEMDFKIINDYKPSYIFNNFTKRICRNILENKNYILLRFQTKKNKKTSKLKKNYELACNGKLEHKEKDFYGMMRELKEEANIKLSEYNYKIKKHYVKFRNNVVLLYNIELINLKF